MRKILFSLMFLTSAGAWASDVLPAASSNQLLDDAAVRSVMVPSAPTISLPKYKNGFFIGADINAYTMAMGVVLEEGEEESNDKFIPNLNSVGQNYAFTLGFKYHLFDSFLFVAPKFTYDVATEILFEPEGEVLEGDNFAMDFDGLANDEVASTMDLKVLPMYSLGLDVGIKFGPKFALYGGIAAQQVDYEASVYDVVVDDEERVLNYTQTGSKLVFPFTVGYVYNIWSAFALDVAYTYSPFQIEDIHVDMTKLKAGIRIGF